MNRAKNRKRICKTKRAFVYNKSGGRCAICGRRIHANSFTVDHIVPLSKGGDDAVENLQATCLCCNNAKGSLTEDQFIRKLWEWVLHNQKEFFGLQLELFGKEAQK